MNFQYLDIVDAFPSLGELDEKEPHQASFTSKKQGPPHTDKADPLAFTLTSSSPHQSCCTRRRSFTAIAARTPVSPTIEQISVLLGGLCRREGCTKSGNGDIPAAVLYEECMRPTTEHSSHCCGQIRLDPLTQGLRYCCEEGSGGVNDDIAECPASDTFFFTASASKTSFAQSQHPSCPTHNQPTIPHLTTFYHQQYVWLKRTSLLDRWSGASGTRSVCRAIRPQQPRCCSQLISKVGRRPWSLLLKRAHANTVQTHA